MDGETGIGRLVCSLLETIHSAFVVEQSIVKYDKKGRVAIVFAASCRTKISISADCTLDFLMFLRAHQYLWKDDCIVCEETNYFSLLGMGDVVKRKCNVCVLQIGDGFCILFAMDLFYSCFPDEKVFSTFLSAGCDRTRFILDFFRGSSLKAYVMPICNQNHIYVSFGKECYDRNGRVKTVLAHYDRAENSPGANDNSFAVFVLMCWAVEMAGLKKKHNVRLIFTDGEEAARGGTREFSVTSQGSYKLASLFRRLKITNDLVFVFDAMGRGTVPVLARHCFSKTTSSLLHRKFCQKFAGLQDAALAILTAACGHPRILPLPYSDNAGFIASGIPASEITMLPEEEILLYEAALFENPALEDFVMNRRILQNASQFGLEEKIPRTWKLFHTERDDQASLTFRESALAFKKILDTLSGFSF